MGTEPPGGLLFEATNNVNNHLDQEPGVIEENRMTVCPSPEMAWSPLGSRPPAKTEEPQTAKEDENTAAAAKWAGPITQDRNQCGTPNHQEASIQHLNCPLCQLEYPCGASLDDHIKVHHQGEGSFTCPLCGHKIQFGTQLERHMAAHSAQVANGNGPEKPQPTLGQSPDNRKFKCSECGKAFKYKHHLKEHVRIHSGEKPYECSHCKKRFSHSGSYSSHLNNKKCLPPTQESVTQPGSSPTSTVKHGSPEQSSNPSPLRLQHNNNEDQNGPGLQREQLEKHTAKNLSMHCFDTGPRSKGMDFPWNALQRVMPVDINEGPLPGIVGQKTDCLLGYLNHSNGQKSYKETMQDLQGRSGVGELQKNHNSDGCSPNSLRSRAIHQAGDIGEKHSPLSYPRGDVSGLKTHENSIVGEDITRTFPTPEHQGQDCRIPCEASDLRKLCRTNPYSPTHAQGHHSKNNNDSRNHQAKQDPWSPHAVRDLWSACSPDVKEKESVSELPRIATIDHHRLARLHSPRQPLHYPRPTSHNPLVSMDCSTSEGVQAEPLDLSLPRPSKELPLVPWTKRGTETDYAGKGDTLGDQDDLKGHPLFSRLEMKTNSFFPSSPYPFFPSLLPSSLNNFLQEQYPLLQVNSNFQGLPFLPYMTYIYGAEPSYILPSVMQDKHRPLGEFFSLTKHPEMGEDIADEELSPLRKKLKKTDEGFYSCDQCDKTFQKSSSLLRHKYEHTGKRPHQCAICQKAFKHKHHLIEHSRLHSGEKPYQCNKCGKRFSHSGSYSQHMNHRYAYCRKDEGMEFSGDCMDTPRSAEDSSGGTPSPDRNSGSSQGEFEHTHHRYRNGVSSSPSYAKNSSQELLPNVGP